MPPRIVNCGFQGLTAPQQLATDGPTLRVDIGFDPLYRGSGPATFASNPVDALVDTGAESCFIDDALAVRLRLPIVDRLTVAGSIGKHKVSVYLGHILVPALGVIMNGRFGGVDLSGGGQKHSALMGRSFLAHFLMRYDGRSGAADLTLQ